MPRWNRKCTCIESVTCTCMESHVHPIEKNENENSAAHVSQRPKPHRDGSRSSRPARIPSGRSATNGARTLRPEVQQRRDRTAGSAPHLRSSCEAPERVAQFVRGVGRSVEGPGRDTDTQQLRACKCRCLSGRPYRGERFIAPDGSIGALQSVCVTD